MNKNKIKNLVGVDSRQLELIEKYYYLDREKKLIDVDLNYDSVDDILDKAIGNPMNPQFSKDVLQTIDYIIADIPTGYKVNVNFVLKDYKNYDPKVLMDTFNNTLELRRYSSRKRKLNKHVFSGILIFIGISILLLMIFLKNYSKTFSAIQQDIMTEVLDITAWVFIWEAITLLFLDNGSDTKFAIEIRRKVNQISFYTDKEETPLLCEENKEIFKNWESVSRLKTFSKYLLLVTSIAYLVLAVYLIYDLLAKTVFMEPIMIVPKIMFVAFALFGMSIFAGICGIKIFLNKPVKHYNLLGIYSIFTFFSFIATVIISIVNKDTTILSSSICSMIVGFLYSIAFFSEKYSK